MENGLVLKHHSLGRAAGARGVDDAGDVGRRDLLGAAEDIAVVVFTARDNGVPGKHVDAQMLLQGRRIHHDNERHAGETVGGFEQRLRKPRGRDDHALGAAVFEDVAVIVHGVGRVGRHGDRADGHDRQVGDQPLGPVLGDDNNPVTTFDAGRPQTTGEAADTGGDIAPAQRPVAAIAFRPQQRPLAEAVGLDKKHGDEVRPRSLRRRIRSTALRHGCGPQ